MSKRSGAAAPKNGAAKVAKVEKPGATKSAGPDDKDLAEMPDVNVKYFEGMQVRLQEVFAIWPDIASHNPLPLAGGSQTANRTSKIQSPLHSLTAGLTG